MDLCDRNDIQALLARHGFHFAKALGQNFLIRGDVAEDIAAAAVYLASPAANFVNGHLLFVDGGMLAAV